MQLTYWKNCSYNERNRLLTRPAITVANNTHHAVNTIIQQVKRDGDKALKFFSQQFDNISISNIRLDKATISYAINRLNNDIKNAMNIAAQNIEKFHQAQLPQIIKVETQPGVICQQISLPIKSVGLYIPGGSAPLLSTVLMLGIPAKIAGCNKIILCSPPPIADEILYATHLCGITDIYQIGGAQAIAAMAFGTQTITKVDKIFGPGNAYVTEAKRQVSQYRNSAAIDMPAGPSEILIIADSGATPEFIAADLLSQAEHGPDSQVILVTPDSNIAQAVASQIKTQLRLLSRAEIAKQALKSSRLIVTENLEQCIEISNYYGPEHLIIQTRQPADLIHKITTAGSVFLGDWSPESAGDYASGTNHVLPTYGYAATYSSLGLADFQKRMTIQQLTPAGLLNLAPVIEIMAEAEQLTAHKRAVSLRVNALNS